MACAGRNLRLDLFIILLTQGSFIFQQAVGKKTNSDVDGCVI
jgi:hypothetical protein